MTEEQKNEFEGMLVEVLGELSGGIKNLGGGHKAGPVAGMRFWVLAGVVGLPTIGNLGWTVTRDAPEPGQVAVSAADRVGRQVKDQSNSLERRISELEHEVEDLAADCRKIDGDVLDGTGWLAAILGKANPRAARKIETPEQWSDEE